MKYNLAQNSYITTVGNVDLTIGQMLDLVDYSVNNAVTISGSGDHIFAVEVDLGARVKIGEIQYFFDSNTSSGIVASGIEFYQKNESFEDYSVLDTEIGGGYYYTTVPDVSAPRFILCRHTVSGTGIVGNIDSFGILNNDDIVDFGAQGELESESFILALDEGDNIKEIPIYNDSETKSTAYVIIEPQGTGVDRVLSISNSSSGPWTGIRDQDVEIASSSSWNSGNYTDTKVVAGSLVVDTTITGVGTYTTRIFEKDASEKFSYIDLDTTSVNNAIVAVDADDIVETLEIRSSRIKPKDYSLYRVYYLVSNEFRYKDYWRETDELKYTSEVMFTYNISNYTVNSPHFVVDNTTEKTAGMFGLYSSTQPDLINIFTLTRDEIYNEATIGSSTGDNPTIVPYKVLLDYSGGVWVYLYVSKVGSGYWLDDVGYFLGHFDPALDSTFKVSHEQPFIFDCDVVYDTKELWYSDISDMQIRKISDTGGTLVSYAGEAVRGVCAIPDGGCWFVDGDSLHRLNGAGTLIDSIENIGEVKLSKVARCGDENLWVRDNDTIKLIDFNGQTIFSMVIPQSMEIYPSPAGLWVQCYVNEEIYYKFVGKNSRVIEQEFQYDYDPGFLDHGFDDISNVIYPSRFPVSFDSTWQNIEWRKVTADTYIFPAEDYHQLRLTLRANEGLESPVINGLYIQKSLEVADIYSKSFKNIYLKIQMSSSDVDLLGEHGTNLRVRWDLPV